MHCAFSGTDRRRYSRPVTTLGAALLVLAFSPVRSWAWPPDDTWTSLARDGKVIVDPSSDIIGSQPERDAIGCDPNSTLGIACNPAGSHPAVYISSDADVLYFRLRVSSNPGTAGTFQFGYGCQINTNGILSNADHCYEKMVVLDKAVSIDVYTNPATGCVNSPGDAANTLASSKPETSANARSVADSLGYFVDFAVPWAALPKTAPLAFVCGTNSNGGNVFTTGGSADIINNNDATTIPLWSAIRSDEYLCSDQGCTHCPFAPLILSADNTTFETDGAASFQVTATGCPPPALSETGALPDGITFDTASGTLGGTTTAAFAGDYPLTFIASNGTDAFQDFTLHVVPHVYTLTYAAGAHGSISGDSPQMVNSGASGSVVTAVPDPSYHFAQWSDTSTQNPRQDTNVSADVDVTASFVINMYTLTYAAGAGGTIIGDSLQIVAFGESGSPVTAVPDPAFDFVEWSDASLQNPRQDFTVAADIDVTAIFSDSIFLDGFETP